MLNARNNTLEGFQAFHDENQNVPLQNQSSRRAFANVGNRANGLRAHANKGKKMLSKSNGNTRFASNNAPLRQKPAALQPSKKSNKYPMIQVPQMMELGAVDEMLDELNTNVADMSLDDIDQYDEDDPQCVTEFVSDIYEFLRYKENKFPLNHTYLESQKEITPRMRRILVDWLFDVHLKFKLLNDTIYMTVFLLDKYLSLKNVARKRLQLIGVTAMLIASKYEEIYSPEVSDFVYICDKAYSHEEILEMEREMLNTLGFDICAPTPLHFLRRFSKAARSDSHAHTLSKYLLELSLQEYHMLQYKPSMLAASAVYIARKMMSNGKWGSTLSFYSNYSEEQIKPCVLQMNKLVHQAGTGKACAVYRKYTHRFFQVATITPVSIA